MPGAATAEVAGEKRGHKEDAESGNEDMVDFFATLAVCDLVLYFFKLVDFTTSFGFQKCHNTLVLESFYAKGTQRHSLWFISSGGQKS